MSSLLDDAIVDAKALREAVLKNAEASLLEAYAPKIEEAVEKLLEQDLAAAALPMDIGAPPADIGAPPGGLGMAPDPVDAETGATFAPGEEEELGDVGYASLTDLDDDSDLEDEVEIDVTRGELQAMLESITRDIDALEEEMGVEDLEVVPPMDEGQIELDEETIDLFEGEEGQTYKAEKGDTLEGIAEKLGISPELFVGYQIVKGGPEIDLSVVHEDQIFMVPPKNLSDDEKSQSLERGKTELAALKNLNEGNLEEAKEGDKCTIKRGPNAGQEGVRNENLICKPIVSEESLELSEENIEEIVESLVVDLMPTKSGWAGTPESVMQHNEELAAAMAQSDEYKEERDELLKVGKTLQEALQKHQTVNAKLKEAVEALKERLDEVNLANAKLLYTNRVLRKSSLNERQKETIVEALSNAGSVNEAKVLYETLQNAVGTSRKSGPQSLSEAVSRPSSMLPRRKIQESNSNLFSDRMKLLAGIKDR